MPRWTRQQQQQQQVFLSFSFNHMCVDWVKLHIWGERAFGCAANKELFVGEERKKTQGMGFQ